MPSKREELRALCVRVHWLAVADADRLLAASERALAEGAGEPEAARSALRGGIDALRRRLLEYRADQGLYTQQDGFDSARRFIETARRLHAAKPEFGFLFSEDESLTVAAGLADPVALPQ